MIEQRKTWAGNLAELKPITTASEAQQRTDDLLAQVRVRNRFDRERVHIDEDDLYFGVLMGIASGEMDDPRAAAETVLRMADSTHVRWYA